MVSGSRFRVVTIFVVLTLLVAACTGDGSVVTSTVPERATPIDVPPPDPIAPVLHRAGPPGDSLIGAPTLVGAYVLAANPVDRLELWDGGDLVDTFLPDDPTSQVTTAWEWIPETSGLHALTMRAYDVRAGVATSFPVWVRVSAPLTPLLEGARRPAVAGARTLAVVSASSGSQVSVDTAQCLATLQVPAVDDSQGIAVYAASFGAMGFVSVGLLSPQGGGVSVPIGATPVLIYAEPFKPAKDPGPPVLVEPPQSCAEKDMVGDIELSNGILTNDRQADRAYLYMSHDGGKLWDRVPADDQTFVYPGSQGDFDFSGLIPAVDPGESASFEAWGWVDDELTPLGRDSWGGPVEGGSALQLASEPFSGPLLASSDLDWVVKTPDVLIRKGTICTYTPAPAPLDTTSTVPVSVVGGTEAASPSAGANTAIGILPESCANAPTGDYSKTFRWEPLVGGYEAGMLQVSTKPFPSGPVTSFPGLVHIQTVGEAEGGIFEFEVPLDDIIDPPPAETGLPEPEQLTYQVVAAMGGVSGSPSDTDQKITFVPLPQIGGSGLTLHLRVVPLVDGKPAIGESNEVVVDVDDTPPPGKLALPPPPPGISLEVTMVPPQLPNPSYGRCVRVVENPFGSANPPPSQTPLWFITHGQTSPGAGVIPDTWYGGLEKQAYVYENGAKVYNGMVPGAVVCASKLSPPSKQWWEYLQDAIDFAGYVWDLYVTVWDKLKGVVSDVLAEVSGCVALAQQVGKSEEAAKKMCSGLANTAIGIAGAAYGVPPTVPKFEELAALGEGKIKELLVDAAFDAGLDCGVFQAECEDMIDDLLDELLGEMKTAATQAAVSAATQGSQWVLPVHPGIYVVPEPAGASPKALFELKITRSPDPKSPPPPAMCVYTAGVTGHKDHYEWQDYKHDKWATGQVEGEVMEAAQVTVDLSELGPGEMLDTAIVLDQMTEFYLPGQNPQWDPAPWNVTSKTWIFLSDYGNTATPVPTTLTTSFSGGPLCGSASQTFPVDHTYAEPWEIPFP